MTTNNEKLDTTSMNEKDISVLSNLHYINKFTTEVIVCSGIFVASTAITIHTGARPAWYVLPYFLENTCYRNFAYWATNKEEENVVVENTLTTTDTQIIGQEENNEVF